VIKTCHSKAETTNILHWAGWHSRNAVYTWPVARIVPWLDHDCSLSNLFQYFIHHFSYHNQKHKQHYRVKWNTNLMQHCVHIAYKSSNTIQQRTRPRTKDTTQDKDKSGIYNLTCKTCKKSYIGQTSRTLTIRHREHTKYIKNDPQSAYALHILQNIHEYGPISDTLSLLKPIKIPTC